MIRRSAAAAAAVLAAVATLASCTTVVSGYGTTRRPGAAVSSPDGDFSVTLPSGWADAPGKAAQFGAVTVYMGPAVDGFASNINVTREDVGDITVTEYQQRTFDQVRAQLHATLVDPPSPLSVDGDAALEYTVDDQQVGRSLRQRQTLVVHDGSGYVITYTALRTAFDASSEAASAVVASWQWG